MTSHCHRFAKAMWTQMGYKRKHISVVSCCGGWFVETPMKSMEIKAHCKWCAVAEVISKEGDVSIKQ